MIGIEQNWHHGNMFLNNVKIEILLRKQCERGEEIRKFTKKNSI